MLFEDEGEAEGPVWSGDAGPKRAAPPPIARVQGHPDAYVPWRIQSAYSFRESLVWPAELAAAAASSGLATLALADREGLWGAVPFVQACQAAGIKPILGALVPVAAGGHLPLYARNAEGWRSLCRVVTHSQLVGPPAWGELAAEAEGLLALGGGDEGPMGLALAAGDDAQALAHARAFAQAFPGAGFLEVPRPEAAWRVLAAQACLAPVAAWPVRYLEAGQARIWALLQQGHHRRPPERLNFHLRGVEGVRRAWASWPEALARTRDLAEACTFDLPMGVPMLPRLPEVDDPEASLRALCEAALPWRYGPTERPDVRERLEFELRTIFAMGFADYFLIQAEIVAWCRAQGVAVGPGKGSGASSLVGYLLGLSDVCPLALTLCFERFLNPERPELPDIDLDVCWRRRDEVLAHVSERHGHDRVARLGVVQHLGARGALRLAGQALGQPPDFIGKVAKASGSHGLAEELAKNPVLQAVGDWTAEPLATWAALAIAVEGLPDHVGLHPCGIAICPKPLSEVVPLMRAADGQPMVQADKDTSEDLGLLKVDILSNRGLTILGDACALVNETEGLDLDPGTVPIEDAGTFAFVATGRTYGVAQLESRPVQVLLRQFKPSTLEDMTAITSLYRPGPIASGAKDKYIARRHGLEKVPIPHPSLEPILAHTYGTVIFQEQVLMTAVVFAGMSLGEGDVLRRTIMKRADAKAITAMAKRFLDGALAKGHPQALVKEVFMLAVAGPSGYGFVKAHAAASQVTAMRQAYVKARWPVHFLAAVLNTKMGYYPPRVYLEDARHFGAHLLGPCVNRSRLGFHVEPGAGQEGQVHLRAGLGTIAELAERGALRILEARSEGPFADWADFLARVTLERDALENLVHAGAADGFGLTRPELLLNLDRHLKQARLKAPPPGQALLLSPPPLAPIRWPKAGLPPSAARARAEGLLGFPLGPPAWADAPQGTPLAMVPQLRPGTRVTVQAELVHARGARTREGRKRMAFMILSDGTNHLDAVAFPTAFKACRFAMGQGGPQLWRGVVSMEPGAEAVLTIQAVSGCDEGPQPGQGSEPSAPAVYTTRSGRRTRATAPTMVASCICMGRGGRPLAGSATKRAGSPGACR